MKITLEASKPKEIEPILILIVEQAAQRGKVCKVTSKRSKDGKKYIYTLNM